MALTGEEVVNAISYSIRQTCSTSDIVSIYTNTPVQGIKKPYAFIHQVEAVHENGLPGRGRWKYLVDVRIHPSDRATDIQSWARALSVKLLDAINKIVVDSQTVKATGLEWKVVDDVLHIIANYSFSVRKASTSTELMENLTYGERLK